MVRMKDERLPKREKETRRLQKMRNTTAKMGGLCEERSEKGRGGRKVERKANNAKQWKKITTVDVCSGVANDQPHPYNSETRGRTSLMHKT